MNFEIPETFLNSSTNALPDAMAFQPGACCTQSSTCSSSSGASCCPQDPTALAFSTQDSSDNSPQNSQYTTNEQHASANSSSFKQPKSKDSKPGLRKTQRVPKTCISCARKKIKCDKVIPCHPCIERGEAHLCAREVVLVKGLMRNVDMTTESNVPQHFMNEMLRVKNENSELLKQVKALQDLVLELRQRSTSPGSDFMTPQLPGLSDLVSPTSTSPYTTAPSPTAKSDATVNHYANALQYVTIGIIEEEETNDHGETPAHRAKLADGIPAFSRRPLDSKDKKPFCPSCSIGEMSHCFAARLPFDNSNSQKIFLSLAFELPEITRKQSTAIVQYALECLNFLHGAVHPPSFYLEHDYFWNSDQPKKLSPAFDRVRGQYLWAAIWYAVLCLGTFYADSDLKSRLQDQGMDDATLKVIPHMFFAASLECLHRGEMYKFPDIRSVQVFCILGPCYQAFAGINMRNCLLNTMVYISQRLNLDKIDSEEKLNMMQRNDYGDMDSSTRFLDREMGRRIWSSVVNSDWLENTGRTSIITPMSFSTVPPGNFNDADLLEYIDEENNNESLPPTPWPSEAFTGSTFQIYFSKLALIKRTYYFNAEGFRNTSPLESLMLANEEVKKLRDSLPLALRNKNSKFTYGTYDSSALSLQRYLIHIATDFELLTINRTLALYVSQNEWNKAYRLICLDSAHSILMSCRADVPLAFKKHPMVSGNGTAAAVYVLLDLLDHGDQAQIKERLKWIDEFLPVLEELQSFHSQARRGISIITKLTTGILLKAEEMKPSKGRKKRRTATNEPAPSLYEIIQRLTILPKVSTAPTPSHIPRDKPQFSEIKIEQEPNSFNSLHNNQPQPSCQNQTGQHYPQIPHQQPQPQQPQEQQQQQKIPQPLPHSQLQQLQSAPYEQQFFSNPPPPVTHQHATYTQAPPPIPQENEIYAQQMRPPANGSNLYQPVPIPDASEVTLEDLEIMCSLTNQDWDTSVVNFSTDFDFDMSILQRPPTDCPDDI